MEKEEEDAQNWERRKSSLTHEWKEEERWKDERQPASFFIHPHQNRFRFDTHTHTDTQTALDKLAWVGGWMDGKESRHLRLISPPTRLNHHSVSSSSSSFPLVFL